MRVGILDDLTQFREWEQHLLIPRKLASETHGQHLKNRLTARLIEPLMPRSGSGSPIEHQPILQILEPRYPLHVIGEVWLVIHAWKGEPLGRFKLLLLMRPQDFPHPDKHGARAILAEASHDLFALAE